MSVINHNQARREICLGRPFLCFGAVNLINKGGYIMDRELLEKPFTPEQEK